MAGYDYKECGIDLQVWEGETADSTYPPPYLLVEKIPAGTESSKQCDIDKLKTNEEERLKSKMLEWA